jgi:hypothetical protein
MALDIIGPGFGRTGSKSMKLALEQLGYAPCHHMHEVGERPELLPAWDAVSRGEAVDWDEVFDGYRSQVDWPGARVWRELVAHYPHAKVVLTVRDPNAWFDSLEKTILPFIAMRGRHSRPHLDAVAEMVQRLVFEGVFDGRMAERDHAIAVFERHNAEVKASVPADRLLVMDVAEGWAPLCRFLGKPVPDTPFPRTNSSDEFKERIES